VSSAFLDWGNAGFSGELIPLCGPHHACASPGKRPHIVGWQDLRVTPAMVAAWSAAHRGNVGLRTRTFPAVDIDVDDAAIASACENVIENAVGSTARRTRDNTHRRLLLFQLSGHPFDKLTIRFTIPGGARAQVEILAKGQQAVVAGIHHTGEALQWSAGQPVVRELATITAHQVVAAMAALRARLLEIGCVVETPLTPCRTPAPMRPRASGQDAVIAQLALRKLDPDVPYDVWLRVGMALHSRWPDERGLSMWDLWSSMGEKYPGQGELERHWASFRSGGGIAFGTLIAIARSATR
jgi:hypothetical protein